MGHGCSSQYADTHRGFVQHAQKMGMVLLICVGIWAMTGFAGTWPVWVGVFLAVKLAMHAKRVYGRDDGADAEGEEEPVPEDDFVIV